MNRIITILVTIFILLLLYIWISHVWGSDNPREPRQIVDATGSVMEEEQPSSDSMDMFTENEPMADATTPSNATEADEFNTDRTIGQPQTPPVNTAVPKQEEPKAELVKKSTPEVKTETKKEEPKSTPATKSPAVSTSKETKSTTTRETEKPAAKPTTVKSTGMTSAGSTGQHLVIAGNFSQRANADQRLQELKKAGFSQAEVVNFDLSEYHTVCAGRFADVNEARKLVKKLKDYHKIDAYVRIGS